MDKPKARINSRVRLLIDVKSDFRDRIIPKGTEGVVTDCYESPKEGYSVDVKMPDHLKMNGPSYDSITLYPEQFDVIAF